ncbi:HAD superfamily hydrolase (TIGR01509 family) [Rubricella aquisinus]|uniref:HAD superfamily hydrolase (TIGR01509 family) n=1 Tax=Rubricella aquisinus TaxID=2028108 RepID=A0A840WSQ7_9RHOB|nr:HAD family phosphatase [Rubricella aquisinus]MBB5516702.1 HAD superfamily hydrolase (TIGR01509 family) [Rubricella aquisinus]
MLRGVLFDCDGVLVDSEPITNRVLRDSLARYGLDMPQAEVEARFIGGTMSGVRAEAIRLGANLPDDWVQDVYDEAFACLEAEVELIPGVLPMLARCEALGLAMGVASNGRTVKMEITLRRTGLAERFAGRTFSAPEIGKPKPAPDVYLAAAMALNLCPQETIVVEDSATGVEAAIAAGMRCFAYVPEGDGARQAAAGATVFRNMDALPALFL